jgi:tripartite-type tricarboxylate transporter receptor subunit TctC
MNPSTSKTKRRVFIAKVLAAGLLPAMSPSVFASEPWPSRPITWVVPYLAGTSPDTTARIVGEAVSRELGQPVVIENRGGLGGNLGARHVARATPDGYTWIYSASPMAANMRMYKAPGYDAIKDFRHIAVLTTADSVVIVNAQSDIQTLQELISRMRAQPGKIDYASGGVGTPSHLGVELILSQAGVQATHIPYKGASQIVSAVMGQQVPFGAPISSVALPNIQSGALRALAVTGPSRNSTLPDVPTLREAGVPSVELTSWGGVSVPAGTPDPIVARIRAALDASLKRTDVVADLEKLGGAVVFLDSDSYSRAFEKEIALTEAMMKKLKIEPN